MAEIYINFYDDQWQPDPAGLNFRGHSTAECGATSAVVNRAWVRYGSAWGKVTAGDRPGPRVVALDGDGNPLAENDPGLDYWELPGGTRQFTVEGRRELPSTLVSAFLLLEAK